MLQSILVGAQVWETETMAPMPEARANSAIAGAIVNGTPCIYSFAGIDSTKIWSGISNRSFRYITGFDVWYEIPALPMEIEVIAAGASTVKNKIYIMGGYTVKQNGSEVSSDQNFEFDPVNIEYVEKAKIPRAIDDQVQCVWRDSLIYVISGWSNTTNVNDVQIYNPSNDTWLDGTPVPDNSAYKVFGASGEIIGDTIYYAGGTGILGFNFELVPYLRKGVINPDNPAEIEWILEENDLALGYRMGATTYKDQVLWIGGSLVSYNYDGIAYNGSGGVSATERILTYSPQTGSLIESNNVIPPTMDLRGIGKVSDQEYYIIGGMENDQKVTNRCYLLKDVEMPSSTKTIKKQRLEIQPNIISDYFEIIYPSGINKKGFLTVHDLQGSLILQQEIDRNIQLLTEDWKKGMYLISLEIEGNLWQSNVVKP